MNNHLVSMTQSTQWYKALLEDCQQILVEYGFTARWALIEGYHELGKRIWSEKKNFNRGNLYGKQISQTIADSLGKSRRTIDRAIQFYRTYPDLNLLPEGKNTSWFEVVNKYLPKPRGKEREYSYGTCKVCGQRRKGFFICQECLKK